MTEFEIRVRQEFELPGDAQERIRCALAEWGFSVVEISEA